ncbi:MAG: hypothetical protein IJX00_01465 [Clostridia bacterium]|nr:hypothetical protein [Clostridia bacterium]
MINIKVEGEQLEHKKLENWRNCFSVLYNTCKHLDFYGFVAWTKTDKQAQQQSTKTQADKNITEEKQA